MGDAARSGFPSGAKSLNHGIPEAGRVADAMNNYLHSGNDSELESCADSIQMDWDELSLLRNKKSETTDKLPYSSPDLGNILQALPLTGNDLDYVANKLNEAIANNLSR